MSTKQLRETRKIEMVETHNLAISLSRIENTAPYSNARWKRALYHALAMSSVASDDILKKIREALQLP